MGRNAATPRRILNRVRGSSRTPLILIVIACTTSIALGGASGIPDGFQLIEGDILVPEGFTEGLESTYAVRLWPDGTVPYEFDAGVSIDQQQAMLAAMAVWEDVAAVRFVPHVAGDCTWLHINDSDRNSSQVGMSGGCLGLYQELNIVSWDQQFIIAHELGHALGYWHEQSRTDRDSFVQVVESNIQGGFGGNFDIRDDSSHYGGYDFDSLMHYDDCAFSICCPQGTACGCLPGCETILVLPPNQVWQDRIGQLTHLSDLDALTMSFLYPQADWRFVDREYAGPQTGTFLEPFSTFAAGVDATPDGGTLWIQPGDYSAAGTHARPMTWRAALETVTLQ